MNLGGKTLLIRTDASEIIGAGHIMRCLALAQAWRNLGGRVIFACCSLPYVFEERLRREQMEIHLLQDETGSPEEARQLIALAVKEKVAAVVVDFYEAKETYLRSLRDPAWKILCVDDNAELPHYPVDFILNQNIHAKAEMYASKCDCCQLLLGPSHALLRNEFVDYRNWRRDCSDEPRSLLITMGGGNQIAALLLLMDRLDTVLRPLRLTVILARRFENAGLLENKMQRSGLNFTLLFSPDNLAYELARHDLLLSSGGATVWEALYMQTPALFVVIAPNQGPSCRALGNLVSHPIASSLDQVTNQALLNLVQNAPLRAKLAREGRAVVDGIGPDRILEMLCA